MDERGGERASEPRLALSRRGFLAAGAGGLVSLGIAGLVGYEWPHARPETTSPEAEAIGVERFVSRPDLRPPRVRVTPGEGATTGTESSPRFIFLAPRYLSPHPSQQGLMICDRLGRLVWFRPTPGTNPFNLDAQVARGETRLTWWEGSIVSSHGAGTDYLANERYETVERLHASHGLQTDLHEFNLTPEGTALITAYGTARADTRAEGGARDALVLVGHAQEIELGTGKVLLDWNSLEHLSLDESYLRASADPNFAFDFVHLNSVSLTPDGNLLLAGRNTWAAYKVDRSSGAVLWRLGGRRSDFEMGAATRFFWEHDVRQPDASTLTVFDDGSYPPEEAHSRALLLDVDERARTVALRRAYTHPTGFLAANQGSMQLLADGRVFVGWGNQPYFSEFAPDGTLVLDGELPLGVRSYRAYTADWTGRPSEPPVVAVRPNPGGGSMLYVSWNGATEVARWVVHGGSRRDDLYVVGSQEWTGFETAIAVSDPGPHYRLVGLDASGRELGHTATT